MTPLRTSLSLASASVRGDASLQPHPGPLAVGEFTFPAFLPSGEFDIVRNRRPRQQGGRDNSMSSHSIHTQSNSAPHDAPRASETVGLFDQAMVTVAVIAIGYITAIMFGWL